MVFKNRISSLQRNTEIPQFSMQENSGEKCFGSVDVQQLSVVEDLYTCMYIIQSSSRLNILGEKSFSKQKPRFITLKMF